MQERKKKKPAFLTGSIGLSLLFFFSQYTVAAAKKSFIWEIRTPVGSSYILGSVHALKKNMYPLPEPIERAFKASAVLVVEVNISPENMGKLMTLTMQKGMYGNDTDLKASISEKTYDLARKKLKEFGLDISGFNKFKPWMLAITISAMTVIRHGLAPNYGVEKYFLEKNQKQKEVLELEGGEYQINLFDSFPTKQQEQFLISVIDEEPHTTEMLKQILQFWMTGNAQAMDRLLNENMRAHPEGKFLYHALIIERNLKMTEKIVWFLKTEKTHFVIVGAGHLTGSQGILQLLRNKGFILKQLE